MRITPRRWHNESWICSIRGHVLPAATAATFRDDGRDAALGLDVGDGTRYSRCLRCDMWSLGPVPTVEDVQYPVVPPWQELDLPRRGEELDEAIVLRLIAIERGLHCVLFTLLAIALLIVKVRLPAIESWAQSIADGLNGTIGNTAQAGSHAFLSRQLASVADLDPNEVTVLFATAVIYAVVEGVEAVYLWKERRWAEYLTVLATLGFVPFEIKELVDRVTVLRVGALVVNLAIVVYLVWNKRLFGVRGGPDTLHDRVDWDQVLSSPPPARATS